MNPAGSARGARTVAGPALFALLLLLSRLPLLGGGYGSDSDAWRNMAAAERIRELGAYVPSRLPGFPIHEGLLVALAPLGPIATNAASALAGAVAVLWFWRTARRLELPGRAWIVTAFAFGPALWVDATQTMDYAFTLAFLLAAHHAALGGRPTLAGVLLGLGTGCRASLAVVALPFLVHALRAAPGRGALAFPLAYGVTAAAVYLPTSAGFVVRGFGDYFLGFAVPNHATWSSLPDLARTSAAFLFGKLGTIALAAGTLAALLTRLARRRAPGPGPPAPGSPGVALELGIAGVTLAFYLVAPLQPASLLPLLPATLLLAARLLPRPALVVACAAIVSASFVTPYLNVARLGAGRIELERSIRRRGLAAVADLLTSRPTAPRSTWWGGRACSS